MNTNKKIVYRGIPYRNLLILLLIIFQVKIYPQKNITENELTLNEGWFICSSEKVKDAASVISSRGYSTDGWYPASVPSTIMGTLVKDSVYKDIFLGDNLKKIPLTQFEKPWWYRTKFSFSNKQKGKFIKLKFYGINYSANVWLNGKMIADENSIKGAFRMFEINITDYIKLDEINILAIEVFPPVSGDPTIGFVDWNPKPPDKNMGIWRPVKLKVSEDVSIDYPFVQSKINLNTLKSAELTVSAELTNNLDKKITGTLSGEIGKIKFSKKVTLVPKEKKFVSFLPSDFNQLKINKPRLWWTYNLGKPELYTLQLKFDINGKSSDESKTRFGIREVSDYINKEGWRGYKLNGKEILVLGGGWVDDLFLNNNYENIKTQIEYIKQMGLNAIRLEGFWGTDDDLYNLCDENGILIMAGWSCQWEWKEYIGKQDDEYGSIRTPEDIKLIAQSWKDQIKWLRNHASIFVWLYGSDRIPRPELEKKYLAVLQKDDPTRPFLASSENSISSITGKVAMKHGPYDYVPPVYWWVEKRNGGALGFNTEAGPGAEVPPLESIEKMISEVHLWPKDSVWNFHCAENVFANLKNYDKALFNRLGIAGSLKEYCDKAQFINYENTRALFEAYIANKYKSTGIIHWMLNAAWPKLWWQLYDYYLMPGGAFFGVKKACEPIHILYNYSDSSIMVVNNTLNQQNDLTGEIRVLNFDLVTKYSKSISLNLPPDKSIPVLQLPNISELSTTYFLDLRLFRKGKLISANFYYLSTHPDLLDTAKAEWYMTPMKEYADLTELNKQGEVHLTLISKFNRIKEKEYVEAEIFNNSNKLAYQIVLSIRKGKNGESVLPIFWDDNYFPLLPGERKIIRGNFFQKDLEGKQPVLKVSGWNINDME